MSPHLFRATLCAVVLLGIAATLSHLLFPELLSPNLSRAMDEEPIPPGLNSVWLGGITVVWCAVALTGGIGLFFFASWSRWLSLLATITSFFFYPLFGSSVCSWLSQALADASWLLFGAALAVTYFSPLSERFEKRRATKPTR